MLASLRPITRLGARAFSTSRSAADVARMTLVGRIGADPVVRQTKNGKDFLTYRVATSDPYIKPAEGSPAAEETTSWHTVFAYGPAIERLSTLEKGTLVYVEASFQLVNEKTDAGEYKTNIFAKHERLNILKRVNREPTEESE